VKLDDLPEPYATRIRGARDPGAWEAHCISARASQWVAWNVCEDAWHNETTLSRVLAAIDDIDAATPGLSGPDLLMECAGKLSCLRAMSEDERARTLGLDWEPELGNLVRVEVPLDAIRTAGALLSIPTLFDNLNPRYQTKPDWRARPEREHRPGEPWGRARDMKDGGPALPEILADVTPASKMDAEILGPVTINWSTRPFLTGAPA
jgi:hypothetical protein